ncbi:hypothetical protein AADEFJLK_01600 [Methylovulum psychrotolerans]|uniref:Uncharacterized protein n=2 Tax=Methylovulum psychrotolerans TaxID=1704499 RepID=A0A2S5CQA9_9GAMM|nr:hypothetical protein AADEFJLK_01600 [Methylovulum psychrotolerans]
MLDGLFAQLAAVPLVPPPKNQREPPQPTDYAAVPPVPWVPPQKTKTQMQTQNDSHAPVDDDRHYCHQCAKLINGRCIASPTRYSPVDTHPRRCADYKA